MWTTAPWKPLWSSRNIQASTISRRPSPRSCLWSVRFSPRHGPRALQCREAFETRDAITIGGRGSRRTNALEEIAFSICEAMPAAFLQTRRTIRPQFSASLTNEAAGAAAPRREVNPPSPKTPSKRGRTTSSCAISAILRPLERHLRAHRHGSNPTFPTISPVLERHPVPLQTHLCTFLCLLWFL